MVSDTMTQMVKVKREKLEACMTCPLCKNLLDDATTISVCLHTFCRKCIYDKLSDEDVCNCPVCDIALGAFAVEKLRADHNLHDLRSKIFPYERSRVSTPDVTPLTSVPVKRKERLLSSLGVSGPKVKAQSGLTVKQSKSVARREALRGGSNDTDKQIKKMKKSAEDHSTSSNLQDSLKNPAHKERQDPSLADQGPNHYAENGFEVNEQKADLWTPLNCLAEAVSRSKSSKVNSRQPSIVRTEQPINGRGQHLSASKGNGESSVAAVAEVYTSKSKTKDYGHKRKIKNETNGQGLIPGRGKRRKLLAANWSRNGVSQELGAVDGARESSPVWFALVAAADKNGEFSLPQISSCYLRMKDGSVPVSFIQKYLVKKLNLASESEVEIMCRGQRVLPTMQLHSLVDLWFRTISTSKRLPATVGASAKDFVMVVSYCRKVPAT